MNLKSLGKREVIEVPWGVWLWQMPSGGFVSDGEDHYYMISGTINDRSRAEILKKAVKSEFGITEGKAVFFSGHRIVSDEEFEEQKMRMNWGLTPDRLDVASNLNDLKAAKNNGRN